MKIAVRIYNTSGGGQYDVPAEADVVAWMKSEGERVVKDDVLCELEMEKGVVEIVAPASGILVDIACPVGKTWMRGEVAESIGNTPYYDPPFCWIETEEVAAVPPQESVPASVADEPVVVVKKPKAFIPLAVRHLMEEHAISFGDMLLRFPHAASFGEDEVNVILTERCVARHDVGHELMNAQWPSAVPAARLRAAELGINLALVRGSGPDGLILAADVHAHECDAPLMPPPIPSTAPQFNDEAVVPLKMSRLLRTIAVNMQASMDIPTVDTIAAPETFDFAPLVSFYRRFRGQFSYAMWFPVMAATARVLGREEFIMFNSFFPEQNTSDGSPLYVHTRKHVHMGISYDRGEAPVIDWPNKTIGGESLRILVIRDAHTKNVVELIREVQRLLKAAARRRFEIVDVSGYTFIFNNIGVIGHHSGRSLLGKDIACQLNLGHVDIHAGKGVLQAVFDHRLISGARSTPFVRAIHKEMTERVIPELEEYLAK